METIGESKSQEEEEKWHGSTHQRVEVSAGIEAKAKTQ